MRRATSCALVVLTLSWTLFGVACSPVTSPQPGSPTLDDSFGSRGMVVTDIGGGAHEDEPFNLILTDDNKYAAPGKAFNSRTGEFDFAILRYLTEGWLDETFDQDGIVLTDFGGYEESAALVQQEDGKLIAGGFTRRVPGSEDFALARYNRDGSLDTTFGNEGRVITDFDAGSDQLFGLALQPDGHLVAGGFTSLPANRANPDFALARYLPDGSLDESFGAGGKIRTDFFQGPDVIVRVALQSEGKILAVGAAKPAGQDEFDLGIARYNADGRPDQSFGGSRSPGQLTTDIRGGRDLGFTVTALPDDRFLVAGLSFNPATSSNDMLIAKYRADGSPDKEFGTVDGQHFTTVDFFGDYDQILSMQIQPDGKIVGVGHAKHPERDFEFAFVRFTEGGELDPSFGNGGVHSIDVFGGPDGLHGVVLYPEGKLVAAGDSFNPTTGGDDFMLLRLNSE